MERPNYRKPLPVKGVKQPKESPKVVKLPTLEEMFGTKRAFLHVLARFAGHTYQIYSIPDKNTKALFRKLRKLMEDAQKKYPEAKIVTLDVNDRTEIKGDIHEFLKAYKADKHGAGRKTQARAAKGRVPR